MVSALPYIRKLVNHSVLLNMLLGRMVDYVRFGDDNGGFSIRDKRESNKGGMVDERPNFDLK